MTDASVIRLGVSYFGNRYLHHAWEDLRAIAGTGASFVVHVMSEADLRWNPGTIADLVAAGREVGLRPWLTPWGVGGVFGGEAANYAVGEHPEACQRASDGRHLPALCPRQPVFRALMEQWLDAAVAAGAEVVQWDELHLALPYQEGMEIWACRCDACQEAFAARFGGPMPETANADVSEFFDDLTRETLAWLVAAARTRGLESSIVFLANESYDQALWRAVAAMDGVRYLGSTAFWLFYGIPADEVEPYIAGWADRIVAATEGTQAEAMGWVQAFRVPAGREREIERATAALIDGGITTVAVWSYLACAAMSGLAADEPDAAWDAVVSAFARARGPGTTAG